MAETPGTVLAASARQEGGGTLQVGYLLSKYPSANHTYLFREVQELRRTGIDVLVAAVSGDDRPEATLPLEEQQERAATFVVKRVGIRALLWAHVEAFATRPGRYITGISSAVRLAGPDLRRLAYHALYFAEAVVAGRYLWRGGCQHVHTHYATTVALLAARVYPFELSASIHGSAEFIDPRAQRLSEKIAACVFVRAISSYGRSQLMLASPAEQWDKLAVIRLGVDISEFDPAPFCPAPNPFRLVSVGQLQPAKGFHVLLGAVAKLVHAGRDVALTLVGDGPDRAALEDFASSVGIGPRVTFTGALTRPAVRAVLRASDAFVLSSFAEGIPVVLMEAMASGVCCIASRITGIPELIEDGHEGLLVTPADEEALAATIGRVIDSPGARATMREAAREKIGREYNLGANTMRLADLFRSHTFRD